MAGFFASKDDYVSIVSDVSGATGASQELVQILVGHNPAQASYDWSFHVLLVTTEVGSR